MLRLVQKKLLASVGFLAIVLMLYYSAKHSKDNNNVPKSSIQGHNKHLKSFEDESSWSSTMSSNSILAHRPSNQEQVCPRIQRTEADMETEEIFPTLNFDVSFFLLHTVEFLKFCHDTNLFWLPGGLDRDERVLER